MTVGKHVAYLTDAFGITLAPTTGNYVEGGDFDPAYDPGAADGVYRPGTPPPYSTEQPPPYPGPLAPAVRPRERESEVK